jgi:hypothetical protein
MGKILKGGIEYTGGGESGSNDYTDLINKPQINGITLVGNKTMSDLGFNNYTMVYDSTNEVITMTRES